MTFDSRGQLWEADNGPDELERADLGANVYQDNPAEELNLLNGPANTFYGYPYCFSAGNITSADFYTANEKGTQYSWPSANLDRVVDDEWCRQSSNNRAPLGLIPAHSSPIAAKFLKTENNCGAHSFSFSCANTDSLFLTLHGSWNRGVPAGYRVIQMPFNAAGEPSNEIKEVFAMKNYQEVCVGTNGSNGTCFRPAGMAFDNEGTLWVTSDSSGHIVKVLVGQQTTGNVKSESPQKRTGFSLVLVMSMIVFVATFL